MVSMTTNEDRVEGDFWVGPSGDAGEDIEQVEARCGVDLEGHWGGEGENWAGIHDYDRTKELNYLRQMMRLEVQLI